MTNELVVKLYSDITIGEWLFYNWHEVTALGDSQPSYVRGLLRPLDESIRLAGSLEALKPYMRTYHHTSDRQD